MTPENALLAFLVGVGTCVVMGIAFYVDIVRPYLRERKK